MLYCKYCNYLKASDKQVYLCELAGIIFSCDIELLNIVHPCKGISLLNRGRSIKAFKAQKTEVKA